MKLTCIASLLVASSASAFTPTQSANGATTAAKQASDATADIAGNTKPLFDPLGLYPANSPEREQGKLQPLEQYSTSNEYQTVKDPLGLYKNSDTAVDDKPMSMSLPFLQQPAMLDGSVPGDRGFDPFNFSSDANALQWYRTAEVKHARLAMLAAAGWPISELLDRKLAYLLNLRPLTVFADRVPSVLNGGLSRTPPVFWACALGVAFAIESIGILKESGKKDAFGTPGDLGFDPLGLASKSLDGRKYQAEAELFNGRLAMLAITGFALQEWWTQNSVINETPVFFKPINLVLEQLQDAAGNGML